MNPYLKDEPKRVGRDPKRKLGARDRLLRPALLAIGDGERHRLISTWLSSAGSALTAPEDPQALEVHRDITVHGIDSAVVAVTGLQRSHPIVRQAIAGYQFAELVR